MTWLAWRQFRAFALVVVVILVGAAIVYGVTGPGLVHFYDTIVKPCKIHHDCNTATSTLTSMDQWEKDINVVLLVLPLLLGMFLGAPLVAREVETGTLQLSWTQSVTRRRWYLTRVAMAVVASMAAVGLFSLMVTWWSSPVDTVNLNPFGTFDERDIVSIGYAAFAVLLGVSLGAVLRRTIPAMAATLGGYVAVRVVITRVLRPYLESPLRHVAPFGPSSSTGGFSILVGGALPPGDWVVGNSIVLRNGETVNQAGSVDFRHLANGTTEYVGVGVCPNQFPTRGAPVNGSGANNAMQKCIQSFHLRDIVSYQPLSRYWTFQWEELALYLVLALALGAFGYWWVRRRVA